MSAATDKTNLAELRRTMTLWHNRVTALGFDGVSDLIALAEAGGDEMKKAWPIGERIALKLMMIKQIGEGSTTANSLPHVARIADEALELIRMHLAGAPSDLKPVAQVVAVEPEGPDGHGVNWLAGKRPKPGDLLCRASDLDQVRAVLRKLVATADMKTRLQALHEMGHGTDWDDWRRLDQEAWATARLLAAEA